MAKESGISWTDATFNPWRGCTKVSAGCRECYAERLSARNPEVLGIWGDNGTRVVAAEKYWREPLKWNKEADASGKRLRVFCASLADVFEYRTDLHDARSRLFNLIIDTPNLDWLLLTKRPETVMELVPESWCDGFPRNVWMGTSTENQATADERIPHLLKIPARVRWLSCEPLLGPIKLGVWFCGGSFSLYDYGQPDARFHWVITGGESGANARPCHPDWVRSLRDQCKAAGVAFHHKQWGEYREFEWQDGRPSWETREVEAYGTQADRLYKSAVNPSFVDLAGKHYTECTELPPDVPCRLIERVGKKAAGRLVDGRVWDESPEVR